MQLKQSLLIVPLLFVLVSSQAQMGCSSSSDGEAPDVATFREAMTQYDPAVQELVTQLTAVTEVTQRLNIALAGDDEPGVELQADALEVATDKLLAAVVELEKLESTLTGEEESAGMITQKLVFTVGVGLVVLGLYNFGKQMKKHSDNVSKARKEAEAAADGVLSGEDGALEKYEQARKKMKDEGTEAAQTLTRKVVTDLVTSPINPTSVGGLLLKDHLGNKLDKGIKVLTTTEGCRTDGEDCAISFQQTDDLGRVAVPAGKQAIVISGPGAARVALKEVVVETGRDTEVSRALIPVGESDPQNVAANDEGSYDPTANPDGGVSGSDQGSSGGGSVSGTYPAEPFNGLQIIGYSISGLNIIGDPVDSEGFQVTREYEVTVGAGTLAVSGTARASNGYSATLTVSVAAGSNTDTTSAELTVPTGGGLVTHDFDISVPIDEGVKKGSVRIGLVGFYNAGTRAVVVRTKLFDPEAE
jgi:hypothetical protein